MVNAGSVYAINDTITVLGSSIGGVDGVNDLTIRILDVNTVGAIVVTALSGISPWMTTGDTFSNVTGTTSGSGIDAEFDLVVASGTATVIDSNSLRFEAPVDIYSNTDA